VNIPCESVLPAITAASGGRLLKEPFFWWAIERAESFAARAVVCGVMLVEKVWLDGKSRCAKVSEGHDCTTRARHIAMVVPLHFNTQHMVIIYMTSMIPVDFTFTDSLNCVGF
jgi:hypothetical protein